MRTAGIRADAAGEGSAELRQDENESINQREDDEELQVTGQNAIVEDKRMLRLLQRQDEEKAERLKVLIASKALAADGHAVVVIEDSNRRGRSVRPWSHHRESQKSADHTQPTMQTMKRTSSKGTVTGTSRPAAKDPFLNVS